MTNKQTTREGGLTIGALLTGMVLGITMFALAYHFGALDSIIATWTPMHH